MAGVASPSRRPGGRSIVDLQAELSDLIADIYDAALDASLWDIVLPRVTAYAGGQAAALLGKDVVTDEVTSFHYFGVTPEYMRAYLDQYYRYDMFGVVEAMGFPLGEPITTVDIIPYEDFAAGRFFREWAEPQGWVDSAWVLLDRSTTGFGFFSVLRNGQSGLVDAETRHRLRLIAPHIRRAALIGNIIDLGHSQAESLASGLDLLRAAVFFVDAAGGVQHANAAGRAMLAARQPIGIEQGTLTATDLAASRALSAAIVACGLGDAALADRAVAIPLESAERHILHVLPLAEGSRRRGAVQGRAVAAVFVQKQQALRPAAPEIIARSYGLTPSELRVLLAIVDVGGVPEVAAALGVAETTVRTHLARLYAKTGVGRQADLSRLVASFASPLIG